MNAKDATSVSFSIDLTNKDDKHSVTESNNSKTSGAETDIEEILEFRNKKDSLRLSASNVAAMAGFHPFSSLPQLMLQLVYQSRRGQQLLAHDSRLLGVSLVTEEEMLLNIATKAGKDARISMERALAVQKGTVVLNNTKEATQLKQNVLQMAAASDKLNPAEIQLLKKGIPQVVDRGYGTHHERGAIDLYETKCGWEIRERNAAILKWPFIRAEDTYRAQKTSLSNNSAPTVIPLASATKFIFAESEQQPAKRSRVDSEAPLQRTADFKPEQSEVVIELTKEEVLLDNSYSMLPFFCIYGAVDGIRDELWYDEPASPSGSDEQDNPDDYWKLRQVVIECKHRMSSNCRARVAPPLYDQIQAVVYCLMYQTSEADLVEVFRTVDKKCQNNKQKDAQKSEIEVQKVEIVASRVSLDDPLNRHGENWELFILPRLRSFVDAVYNIRSDDDKRYRLLSSVANLDDSDAWTMIIEECPWLKNCDTAFNRSKVEKGPS